MKYETDLKCVKFDQTDRVRTHRSELLVLTMSDDLREIFTCERHGLHGVVVVVVEVYSLISHVQRFRSTNILSVVSE